MSSMDSRWSWVVCAVTFFSHIVAVGFSYAISVYYIEFLTVFNESSGTTSWLSSLNYGMLCLIGPVASLFNERFSTGTTMFIGGILSALGLVISTLATDFFIILLSFGILTGIGFGLACTAAIVAIGEHFFKYRSLAFGLSVAGGSVGNMAFPWISTALIDHFGWRGALLISSGFSLNLTVCAMLVVKPSKGNDMSTEITQQQRKKSLKSSSGYYFSNQLYCVDEAGGKGEFFWNNKKFVSIPACPVDYDNYKMNANNSIAIIIDETTKNNSVNNSSIKDGVVLTAEGLNNISYESSTDEIGKCYHQQFEIPKPKINADRTKETTEGIANNKNAIQNGINTKSGNNDNEEIRIEFKEENTVKKSVKEKLKLLYTNVSFVLLLISLSMFLFGTSIVFTHILPYAEYESMSSSIRLLLVSVLGGAGLAGKIGLAAIAHLPGVNPIVLYVIAVFLCGFFTILLAFWNSLAGLVICKCAFGFFSSAFAPTANECVFVISGPELFNFSYGQAIVFMGVGWVVGAPAAGLLFDTTMYYPSSFYFGGAVTILGALVMIPAAIKEQKGKL